MRARLVKWLMTRDRSPTFIRLIEIHLLTHLAARTFHVRVPRLPLSADSALAAYADFTVRCMEQTVVAPETVFETARRLGTWVRRLSGLRDPRDLRQLVIWLYRNIRITLTGSLPGRITVSSCFFSTRYSPSQCAMMSNVDSGIISGLFGGGQLVFTERLTEGCGHCTACFSQSGNGSAANQAKGSSRRS